MVRYPHRAKLTGYGGGLVEGEWVAGEQTESFIDGRYEPVSTNNIIRSNSSGDEVIVRGEFYTKHKPIVGVSKIEITSIGVCKPIICWTEYQKYSIISV